MTPRIIYALQKAGLEEIPDDLSANLFDVGLDSLVLALWVLELEKEFAIRIPVEVHGWDSFQSIENVETHLRQLGAA